jgi:protoheme ferro-lyase
MGRPLICLKPETCEELKTQNRYLFNFFNDPNEKNNIIKKHRILSERLEKNYNEYRSIHNYLNSHKKTEEAKKLSEKALENLKTLGYIK